MPNERPGVRLMVENTVPLPRCCPVSKNPQTGSTLTLSYRARERVLEVYSLQAHVNAYVGGHADGTRNMEAMIQQIAQAAARVLGVRVRAVAQLNLQHGQTMRLTARASP